VTLDFCRRGLEGLNRVAGDFSVVLVKPRSTVRFLIVLASVAYAAISKLSLSKVKSGAENGFSVCGIDSLHMTEFERK
jgi:hypothetical protein